MKTVNKARLQIKREQLRILWFKECIILIEELICSNQALASENEKLRQQQERSNKADWEAL